MTMTNEKEYVHKSEKLYDIGTDAGWNCKIKPEFLHDDPGIITWTIFFSRKPEVMKVVYVGNRMTEAIYKIGDKTTNPPHKAAVVKILLGQPDLSRGVNGAALAKHKKLPFDPDDILPNRILETLLGKRITWLSSLTTELETARIEPERNKGSRYYRIVRSADGRRYVEFITPIAFRAVYLDAIVSVN